jgi:predicted RNA-binding Zn ribbon-like protein
MTMADKPWRFHLSGCPAIDFTNTVSWRASGRPVERLESAEDLVRWAKQSRVITDRDARQLARQARRNPARTTAAVARVRGLREAIYRVFSMIADGHQPNQSDMTTINRVLSEAMRHIRVMRRAHGGFVAAWQQGPPSLRRLLWPVARSVAEVLTSEELGRLKKCPSANCGWIFLDTTRNRTRRWCDMKVCGNRAKARRYYLRKRLMTRRPGTRRSYVRDRISTS